MNTTTIDPELEFPDSDGKPMAENTRQYDAIVALKGNIEAFVPLDAFVAGDHLIYVDSRDPTARQAPDVYIAFGRPRGHRGSYKLWEEENVFPQVIFEVLGPSNTESEMEGKRKFYFAHGAEEYYEFDPEAGTWVGFVVERDTGLPQKVPNMDTHTSPMLGMKFGFRPMELLVFRPDGSRFLSFQEQEDQRIAERQRADAEEKRANAEKRRAEAERQRAHTENLRAETEKQRADAEKQRADQAYQEAERFRAMLRAAGLDPDKPTG